MNFLQKVEFRLGVIWVTAERDPLSQCWDTDLAVTHGGYAPGKNLIFRFVSL